MLMCAREETYAYFIVREIKRCSASVFCSGRRLVDLPISISRLIHILVDYIQTPSRLIM